MSASSIVTGSLIAMIGIGCLLLTPKVWRGYFSREQTRYRGKFSSRGELAYIWWPFGNATRRGMIRGFVPVTIAAWGIVIAYWITMLSSHSPGHESRGVPVAVVAAMIWFGIGVLLLLTVMFFNQPKFVVPPRQRDEPGAIAEWRAASRGKRSR